MSSSSTYSRLNTFEVLLYVYLATPSALLENVVHLEPDWRSGQTWEEGVPDFIHKSKLLSFLFLFFLLPLLSGKEVPVHPHLVCFSFLCSV